MKIEAFFEKQGEKIPGLGYVATTLSLLVAIVLSASSERFDIRLLSLVWLYAVFFYFIGGVLDPVFYDPWFSLYPTDAGPLKYFWYNLMQKFPVYDHDLVVARMSATIKLKRAAQATVKGTKQEEEMKLTESLGKLTIPEKGSKWTTEAKKRADKEQSGIYQTAKALFQKSDSWDARVKPWLELSKAARAFVIPLSLIGASDIVKSIWPSLKAASYAASSPLSWLMNPLTAFGLAFVSLVVYLWWRAVHATHLFELVSEHDAFTFKAQSTEEKDRAGMQETALITTGSAVFRLNKLPLFQKSDHSNENQWVKVLLRVVLAFAAIISIWLAI